MPTTAYRVRQSATQRYRRGVLRRPVNTLTVRSRNAQTTAWRWRADDGSETTATWLAAANTEITVPAGSTRKLRLRFEIAEVGGVAADWNGGLGLQGAINTLGFAPHEQDFTVLQGNNSAQTATSDFVAEGTNTTDQLSGNTQPFQAGEFGFNQLITGLLFEQTEVEFTITMHPDRTPGSRLYFRPYGVDGGLRLDNYIQPYASILLTDRETRQTRGADRDRTRGGLIRIHRTRRMVAR